MDALETVLNPRRPIDVVPSLAALRHGRRDPSVRIRDGAIWRATRTPFGDATVSYERRGSSVVVRAWGPGAEWCIETAPDVLGGRDSLDGWDPSKHALIRELDRRWSGLRFPYTRAVFEAIVPTVLEQKITSQEAHEHWRRMVWRWGEPAPGPSIVRLPPSASTLANMPYYRFHPLGVESRRAGIVRALASRVGRVEEAMSIGRSRLEAFDGVGPWTSAKVAQVAWADPDAVAVGDYHLPSIVVYGLTGKRGGDDDAMLELLEPFRPHRGRAARLLKFGSGGPPRRAPRAPLRAFEAL
jgi:endonuclease III